MRFSDAILAVLKATNNVIVLGAYSSTDCSFRMGITGCVLCAEHQLSPDTRVGCGGGLDSSESW